MDAATLAVAKAYANKRLNWRGAWADTTAYAVNDLVTYNGGLYRALTAFTSGASFVKANWVELVQQSGTYAPWTKPIPDWAPSTAYSLGDVVLYAGNIQQAINSFTSGATFNQANWNLLGPLNAIPTYLGGWTGTPNTGNSSYAN